MNIIRESVRRFSRFGYAAVGLLLVTGTVNAAILVGSAQSMVSTDYGQTLLIKIGFVLAMLVIAARNRFSLSVRLDGEEQLANGTALAALHRSVLVELTAGFMVLAAVALLGTIHPV